MGRLAEVLSRETVRGSGRKQPVQYKYQIQLIIYTKPYNEPVPNLGPAGRLAQHVLLFSLLLLSLFD